MTYQTSTFPHELGISTRVGLTRGAGQFGPGLGSFAEAEMRYREERLLADLRRSRAGGAADPAPESRTRKIGREVMTRWTTWLPSVPHRSSPARPSSSACSN